MTAPRLIFFCMVFLLLCSPAVASDLTKIQRSVAKEPAYRTSPRYCLLVFGSEAKTRVWLILDGDILYVDRNGSGDLTEQGKKMVGKPRVQELEREKLTVFDFDIWPVEELSSGKKYSVALKDVCKSNNRRQSVSGRMFVQLDKNLTQYIALEFGRSAKDAPIIHFGGPLTLELANGFQNDNRLVRGKKPRDLFFLVGTRGVGDATGAGDPPYASIMTASVPDGLCPIVELDFPSKTVGAPPIKIQVRITKRC
jgi:hypothetical protein